MKRRDFLTHSIAAGVATSCFGGRLLTDNARAAVNASIATVAYKLVLESPTKRFDTEKSFAHPRAGIVPGAGKGGLPRVMMTMNTVELTGSDVFKTMYGLTTDDLGKTWTAAEELPTMGYRTETIKGQKRPVACSDFTPMWHAKTKTLLGTGHTVAYTPQWKVVKDRPRDTTYSIYDPQSGWQPWRKLAMPGGTKFSFSGAGCTQRVDEPNGDILLPIYFQPQGKKHTATVMRCKFDGQKLEYVEHGDELEIDDKTRGFSEPSLTHFENRYYLTIRNDERGYVARSDDGLHFESIMPWKFDDGEDLGSYNTQQHWVTHSDGLFLVYTRRGADNDNVFRHRAPLFMAQVAPRQLVVIRHTEQSLVPNRGARLGNFGVTNVSTEETWVTTAEWMQPKGAEKYGADGRVWIARLHWKRPNLAL